MMVITPKGMSYAPGYLTFTTGPNSTSLDIYISNWGGNTQPQYAYNLILRQAGY